MPTIASELKALEAQCAAICREHRWIGPQGSANYRLIYSHPETFKAGAPLMLLGINPHGDPSWAEIHPADLPYSKRGYSAYLDESWGRSPGTGRLQLIARQVSSLLSRNPEQLLRQTPAGNMIPFRSQTLAALPRQLVTKGRPIGVRLVELVQPRVLVLMGGDAQSFEAAATAIDGASITDSQTTPYGANQTYRDVVFGRGSNANLVVALPQRALQKALRDLESRLRDLKLLA